MSISSWNQKSHSLNIAHVTSSQLGPRLPLPKHSSFDIAMAQQSTLLLQKQLKDLRKSPVEGFSAGLSKDNIYEWDIMIIGPPDTLYEGGFFKAKVNIMYKSVLIPLCCCV